MHGISNLKFKKKEEENEEEEEMEKEEEKEIDYILPLFYCFWAREPYAVLEFELNLATCKVSTLTSVLSPQPWNLAFGWNF